MFFSLRGSRLGIGSRGLFKQKFIEDGDDTTTRDDDCTFILLTYFVQSHKNHAPTPDTRSLRDVQCQQKHIYFFHTIKIY